MYYLLNGLNMFVVYQDTFKKTIQIEFQPLESFKPVSPAVIDPWSSYINTMGKSKAPESVSRLFFSTNTCVSAQWFSVLYKVLY